MSKLTKATRVYRGSARGVLPTSFWEPDADHVRGGVEAGFMSTTTDRTVAAGYAGGGSGAADGAGRAPMIFELQQGMINRGAELKWLSQYPHEEEGAPSSPPNLQHREHTLSLPHTLHPPPHPQPRQMVSQSSLPR